MGMQPVAVADMRVADEIVQAMVWEVGEVLEAVVAVEAEVMKGA